MPSSENPPYSLKYFNSSVANLLAFEKEAERLLQYIEKYLSAQQLEEYYKNFSSVYPDETLELFRKALISYAENNLGRSHYEYIYSLMKKMSQIKGGKEAALELAANFRTQYKNRRAMMEILGQFKLTSNKNLI